jgi:uncharacterized membrane protein
LKESIEDIIGGNALNSKMPVLGAIPGTIEARRGTVNNNSSEFLLLFTVPRLASIVPGIAPSTGILLFKAFPPMISSMLSFNLF